MAALTASRSFRQNGNWAKAFYTPGGMVGKHLKLVAKEVSIVSKVLVGSGPTSTGELKRSIKPGPVTRRGANQYVEVIAWSDHAVYHHQGTRPHTIDPAGNGVMVFPSKGRVVITTEVNHPGTTANPFLWDALVAVTEATWDDAHVTRPHRAVA